jgi:hypothetical protein
MSQNNFANRLPVDLATYSHIQDVNKRHIFPKPYAFFPFIYYSRHKYSQQHKHAIHLQFDISANALEIRAGQSSKCIV